MKVIDIDVALFEQLADKSGQVCATGGNVFQKDEILKWLDAYDNQKYPTYI